MCEDSATKRLPNQFGPGSIFDHCGEHSHDLETLATETETQYDILEAVQGGLEPPPVVPFPWESFEVLHVRAQGLPPEESLA